MPHLRGEVEVGFVEKIFFELVITLVTMNLLPTFGEIFFDPGSILKFWGPTPTPLPKNFEFFISLFSPMCDTWLESPGSQNSRTIFIFSVQ